MTRCVRLLVLCWVVLWLIPASVWAQDNDTMNFAEGRIAFEKYHDCPAALKALNRVSSNGQNEPAWIYLSAKVNDCTGNLDRALDLYAAYDKLMPNQPEVVNAIADLRYRIDKKKELVAKNAAIAAAQQQQEQARQQRRADLNGTWQNVVTRNIFNFVYDATGHSLLIYRGMSTNVNDNVALGTYQGGVARLKWDAQWSNAIQQKWNDSNACTTTLPTQEKVTMTISEDGNSLHATFEEPRVHITDDDCSVSYYFASYTYRRQ